MPHHQQRRHRDRVEQAVTFRALDTDRRTVHLPGQLVYRSPDPWAVELGLLNRDLAPRARWLLARDLLDAGTSAPAGRGAVRLRPETDRSIVFELACPTGHLRLWAAHAPIAAFLTATYRLVPTDTEPEHLDLEALASHLASDEKQA